MAMKYSDLVKENKTLHSQKTELIISNEDYKRKVLELEKRNRELESICFKLKRENDYLKSKPSTLVDNLLEFSRNFNNLAN